MSFPLPAELKAAIESYAGGLPRAALAQSAARLTAHYRGGLASHLAITSEQDVAAYLMARLPATFAATSAALRAARALMPSFAPASLLDLCAGPGSASLAALGQWDSLAELTLVDANARFLDAARRLGEAGAVPQLAGARLVRAPLGPAWDELEGADLVVMSYALVELPEEALAAVARRVLGLARGIALFVEPGTPEGFRRILLCREVLLAAGAAIVAPCPHASPCPMQPPAWCHFSERLPRSRDHRLVKQASLPFEDEPYAYLAVGRRAAEIAPAARLVSHLRLSKARASCQVCARDGKLAELVVPRREREAYGRMRRRDWGDALLAEPDIG